jgi:predicted Rossmann fold nucleotide-binding protein DprA/Smf involved in DNA uptake
MEQECLKILSRGKQPIIICPARSIGAKTVREHAYGIEQGRLLILSPFSDKDSRITAEAAEIRNRFAAALADALFIAYAAPGGQMEQLCLEVITWGKPLYTFADEANAHLIAIGAKTVTGDWTP